MNCPGCGHPIQICQTAEGERVPLETYTEMSGERRYTVVKFGNPAEGEPHTVAPVAPRSLHPALPDHRIECRAWEDGRHGRFR